MQQPRYCVNGNLLATAYAYIKPDCSDLFAPLLDHLDLFGRKLYTYGKQQGLGGHGAGPVLIEHMTPRSMAS